MERRERLITKVTKSRAIVGVELSYEGSDSAGLSEPMRQQVEQRSGHKVL